MPVPFISCHGKAPDQAWVALASSSSSQMLYLASCGKGCICLGYPPPQTYCMQRAYGDRGQACRSLPSQAAPPGTPRSCRPQFGRALAVPGCRFHRLLSTADREYQSGPTSHARLGLQGPPQVGDPTTLGRWRETEGRVRARGLPGLSLASGSYLRLLGSQVSWRE